MPGRGGIRDDIGISRARILLLLAIFLGTAIRIYDLTEKSLWYDEVNGILVADGDAEEILGGNRVDVSPPLHYLLLHYWVRAFGIGEAATRAFACLFGVLFLPAIYLVGANQDHRKERERIRTSILKLADSIRERPKATLFLVEDKHATWFEGVDALERQIRARLALSEGKQFGSTHISVFRSPLSS